MSDFTYRVASALVEKHYNLFITSGTSKEMSAEDLVKSVISLMHEPTKEMYEAVSDDIGWGLRDTWQAMIDKALE